MAFDTFLASGRPDPRTTRAMRRALGLALGVHVLLLVAAVVHAGWRVDEISPPALPTVIFRIPPTPPPPAGGPQAERRPPRPKRQTNPAALVQPVERQQPTQVENRDPPSDLPGSSGGQPGSQGPPCDAADCTGPAVDPGTFVKPNVASGRLAIDPQAEPYRVKLPPALNRAGMRVWLLAKLCVRADGTVERVSLLRGADPALDPLVVATLQTWRYRPYEVNGRPVPFCTNVRYEIATQ